jgi:hypothetical protein
MTHPQLGMVGRLGLWRLRHNTARSDIVGADQPQPIDPLGVGEVGCMVESVQIVSSPGNMDQPEGVGKGANRNSRFCHSPGPAGTAPNRMNRTRSNRLRAASTSPRSPCTHRKIDRHQQAFARRLDGCIAGRSTWTGVASAALRECEKRRLDHISSYPDALAPLQPDP